jgi:hypothetical protein
LVDSSILLVHCYYLSFNVLVRSIKNSVVVSEVHELLSSVLEQLPPSRASAPDLHIICLS